MPDRNLGQLTLHTRIEPETVDLGRLASGILAGRDRNCPALLQRLSGARECLWVERKTVASNHGTLAEEAAHHFDVLFQEALGLANLQGGVILVGVEDGYDAPERGPASHPLPNEEAHEAYLTMLARIWGKDVAEVRKYPDPAGKACDALRDKFRDKPIYRRKINSNKYIEYTLLDQRRLECDLVRVGFDEQFALAIVVRPADPPLIGHRRAGGDGPYHAWCRAPELVHGLNRQESFASSKDALEWVAGQRRGVSLAEIVKTVKAAWHRENGDIKLLALHACDDPPTVLPPDKYPPIGSGAEATVYAAMKFPPANRPEQIATMVAIRVTSIGNLRESKHIIDEKDRVYIKGTPPATLVRLFRTWEYEGYRCEEMEFVPGEDCAKLLGKHRFDSTPPRCGLRAEAVAEIARGVFSALAYLHEVGLVHRDISFGNVMYCQDGPEPRVRVIDFGKTRFEDQSVRTGVGTAGFQPPEAADNVYNAPGDVFAAGVLTLNLLWGKGGTPVVPRYALQRFRAKFVTAMQLWDYLGNVTSDNPDDRPTADTAMQRLPDLLVRFAFALDDGLAKLPHLNPTDQALSREFLVQGANATTRELSNKFIAAVVPIDAYPELQIPPRTAAYPLTDQRLDSTSSSITQRVQAGTASTAESSSPAGERRPLWPALAAAGAAIAVLSAFANWSDSQVEQASPAVALRAEDGQACPNDGVHACLAHLNGPNKATNLGVSPQGGAVATASLTPEALLSRGPDTGAAQGATGQAESQSGGKVEPSESGADEEHRKTARPTPNRPKKEVSQSPPGPVVVVNGAGDTDIGKSPAVEPTAPVPAQQTVPPPLNGPTWSVDERGLIEPGQKRAWETRVRGALAHSGAEKKCAEHVDPTGAIWRLPDADELDYFRWWARKSRSAIVWNALGRSLTNEYIWSRTKDSANSDSFIAVSMDSGFRMIMSANEKRPFLCVRRIL